MTFSGHVLRVWPIKNIIKHININFDFYLFYKVPTFSSTNATFSFGTSSLRSIRSRAISFGFKITFSSVPRISRIISFIHINIYIYIAPFKKVTCTVPTFRTIIKGSTFIWPFFLYYKSIKCMKITVKLYNKISFINSFLLTV